jgi:hypothetical protein
VPFVRIALVFAALASLSRPALAQLRTVHDNFNMWFTYNGEGDLAGKWGVIYDFSLRRSGPLSEMYALFARGGVTYALTPQAKVAVGINRSETWPYGEVPIAYRTPERRLWEQLQLTHSVGRVGLTHRYRLEQRWQGKKSPPSDEVTNWVRTNRFRYLFRGTIPLQGKTLDPHEFYTVISNELFASFGANVQYNVFDQIRSSASLGYRLTKGVRLEAGFLEQLSEKSDGKTLEQNHTIILGLLHSWSLKHEHS